MQNYDKAVACKQNLNRSGTIKQVCTCQCPSTRKSHRPGIFPPNRKQSHKAGHKHENQTSFVDRAAKQQENEDMLATCPENAHARTNSTISEPSEHLLQISLPVRWENTCLLCFRFRIVCALISDRNVCLNLLWIWLNKTTQSCGTRFHTHGRCQQTAAAPIRKCAKPPASLQRAGRSYHQAPSVRTIKLRGLRFRGSCAQTANWLLEFTRSRCRSMQEHPGRHGIPKTSAELAKQRSNTDASLSNLEPSGSSRLVCFPVQLPNHRSADACCRHAG